MDRMVAPTAPHTTIIAEAGVNHNGDLALAKRLIDVGAAAGVDFVKFQAWSAKRYVSRHAAMARYQVDNIGVQQSQLAMLEKLELTEDDHRTLHAYCRARGVGYLCSPFDIESVAFLDALDVAAMKIPSGEITNVPYLRAIGRLRRPVILSTGMADLEEVRAALAILTECGAIRAHITLLHCHSDYPTHPRDVNLRAMQTLQVTFGGAVGYSDHTLGIEIPIAAVALGATVIEKHVTLDRTMEGPDHKASIEPAELQALVAAIRNIEQALGDGVKRPTHAEQEIRPIARKSIVARCAIARGDVLTEMNLTTKRPGTGISPTEWDCVIGSIAKRTFQEDECIEL